MARANAVRGSGARMMVRYEGFGHSGGTSKHPAAEASAQRNADGGQSGGGQSDGGQSASAPREPQPPLSGLRILKTDLWDEAKNTRILAWAAGHGAHAFGVDISIPTVTQARAATSALATALGNGQLDPTAFDAAVNRVTDLRAGLF